MSAQRALSSPSEEAKEDNIEKWSGAIFVIKFWSVTHEMTDENMEETSDIDDNANSILHE